MDNAEKVRSKIRKAAYRPLTLDERSWSLAALAALEQQAAGAEAQPYESERELVALLEAERARAVRAEEALRRAHRYGTTETDAETAVVLMLAAIHEALAAAGADTEKQT